MMKTVFVYQNNRVDWGSTQRRGFDLGKTLRWDVLPLFTQTGKQQTVRTDLQNTRVVSLKLENYDVLKRLKNCEVVIEMADFQTLQELPKLKTIDYGLFTSNAQRDKFSRYFRYPQKCAVVYHHWNSQLAGLTVQKFDTVQIGYLGIAEKCHLYQELSGVQFHKMASGLEKDFQPIMQQYEKFNVHYVIKPKHHEDLFQSMTKIATAATLGCPAIAMRNVQNEELLTAEYPYFCESFDKQEILRVIQLVHDTFQKDAWQLALRIMEKIKARTSLEAAAREYQKLFP